MKAVGARGLRKLAMFLIPMWMEAHCGRCGCREEGFSWVVLWRLLLHECPQLAKRG